MQDIVIADQCVIQCRGSVNGEGWPSNSVAEHAQSFSKMGAKHLTSENTREGELRSALGNLYTLKLILFPCRDEMDGWNIGSPFWSRVKRSLETTRLLTPLNDQGDSIRCKVMASLFWGSKGVFYNSSRKIKPSMGNFVQAMFIVWSQRLRINGKGWAMHHLTHLLLRCMR